MSDGPGPDPGHGQGHGQDRGWGGVGWGDLGRGDLGWGGGRRWGWAFLFFFTLFRLHDHVIQLAPSAKMLGCCSIHTSLGLFL